MSRAKAKPRYTITVEEEVEETQMTPRQFVKGGEPTEDNPDGYGYPEQVPEKKVVSRIVYQGSSDTCEIVDVVKAIHGIA